MGEGANTPEAQWHPDRTGVDAAGCWGDSHAAYPGRPGGLPLGLGPPQGGSMTCQESAEAILTGRTPVKGRTCRGAPGRFSVGS